MRAAVTMYSKPNPYSVNQGKVDVGVSLRKNIDWQNRMNRIEAVSQADVGSKLVYVYAAVDQTTYDQLCLIDRRKSVNQKPCPTTLMININTGTL